MKYFRQANEMYNIKDYRKAIVLYKRSIEKGENLACALYNAAVCHIKLNEFNEAIVHLKEALKHRIDAKYLFNLGYCFNMIKDYKKALIYFNYSWSLDNTDIECEKAINSILKKVKKVM